MTTLPIILINSQISFFFFTLQTLIVLSSYTISPSPDVFSPEVSKYFGRYLFLTYQANHLIMIYYFFNFISDIFSNYEIKKIIFKFYSLAFCLSFFVTIGYYLLDYSNPENVLKRKLLSSEYKYIYISSHFEHSLTLPLILLFYKNNLNFITINSYNYVFIYSFLYISLLQYNKYLTGKWPYPIISDIENNFGFMGKNFILLFLMIIFNSISNLIYFF